MLEAVDRCPVTRHQKLRLYKMGICPRLSWTLMVEEFPLTWLERHLQPLTTRYLKKWAGLAKTANTAILFLPTNRGGLALPSLVTTYKKQQTSRMAQLLTSGDPGVRSAANLLVLDEEKTKRSRLTPAVFVNGIRELEPPKSKQALARSAKSLVAEEDNDKRHQDLCSLAIQGDMARRWEGNSPQLWVKAVEGLPPEVFKFSLNAALDTLPSNINLRRWGKKNYDICPLCSSSQSLQHVLNNCPTAMNLRRYSMRHDNVLEVIGEFVKNHLEPSFTLTIDLPSMTYKFPQHIVSTDMRPDITWWCDDRKELWLLELTISFESQMEDARHRKQAKYRDLVEAGQGAGFRTNLITIEVGSRGMVDISSFSTLRSTLAVSQKDMSTLCISIIRRTVLESHKIWCSRNIRT